jgi:hypothetical protein
VGRVGRLPAAIYRPLAANTALAASRTFSISKAGLNPGTADFYVLLSPGATKAEVKFISGAQNLRAAAGFLNLADRRTKLRRVTATEKLNAAGKNYKPPGRRFSFQTSNSGPYSLKSLAGKRCRAQISQVERYLLILQWS